MRPALLAVLALLLCAPAATAQTTGPTGPTVVNPAPPSATTGTATDVGQTTATVRGTVDPNGAATSVRFEYGTTTSYGLTTPEQTLPAGASPDEVEARLERLTVSTTYHVRVVATNAAGVARGADRTFRTASAPSRPSVASEPARDLATDAATLAARVDPNRQAATYVFEYGTTTRYGTTTPAGSAGSGDAGVRVTTRIGGLLPNTTYNFRVRATNASGTTLGARRTFRTAKVPLGLSAVASPSVVRYTRTLTITGTVTGTDRRGVPVTLERRNFPFDAGFTAFGAQLLTDSSGVMRFLVPPFTLGSQFRLVAPSRGGLTSNVTTVGVRALVTLRARRLRGGRVRLSGSVAPENAAGLVSIQLRGSTGRYATVRRTALRRAGSGASPWSCARAAPPRPTGRRPASPVGRSSTGAAPPSASPRGADRPDPG